MASVKTTISLKEKLFKEAEDMARELELSRSGLFALALEEFLRRRENQKLFEQINAAHASDLDEEEKDTLRAMRRLQRESIEDEW